MLEMSRVEEACPLRHVLSGMSSQACPLRHVLNLPGEPAGRFRGNRRVPAPLTVSLRHWVRTLLGKPSKGTKTSLKAPNLLKPKRLEDRPKYVLGWGLDLTARRS